MEETIDLSSEDFLDIVWGEDKGWVDLPAKVAGYWVPWHHRYTGEADTDITRRIDACLRDEESLYFSVGKFTARGRNFDDLKPPQWLWADLDEIHPSGAATSSLLPTIAWESSRGRFQALWRLNARLRLDSFDRVNQALSYFLGADRGGWDRTQVLRLPGTRNYKYPDSPEVRLLWYHPELVYKASYIWSVVRDSAPATGTPETGIEGADRPRAMPARVRALLRVPADAIVEGERSTKLWQIECLLAESGWGEDAIYTVVAASAWNKWSAVGTGERRLRSEIRKAIHHVARLKAKKGKEKDYGSRGDRQSGLLDRRTDGGVDHEDSETSADTDSSSDGADEGELDVGRDSEGDGDESLLVLPFVRYGSFMAMAMEEPRWLIQDLWTAGSHGILGGEPKTSKTTLGLAMAVAVASGKPFMGDTGYRVRTPGPVLLVQEENAPWMVQDRLRKLAWLSGLIPEDEVRVLPAQRGALGKKTVELEFPSDIPLRLLNNWGLDLTDEEHREALWAQCEVVKPKLVILDPLYLIFAGLDFDKAHELAPYLKWMLALSNEFNTALCVVHHFRKANAIHTRPGQRLMGNATLHGWVDSALYAEQIDPNTVPSLRARKGTLFTRVEREFRSIEPQGSLEFAMRMGQPGQLEMGIEIGKHDLQRSIEDLVIEQPGITVTAIAEALGIDKRTALGRCRDSSVVVVKTGRVGRGHSHTVYVKDQKDDD